MTRADTLTYRPQDAGAVLGVSYRTVLRWVADGRIRKVPNTGKKVLIARAELERFVNQGIES